MKLYFRNLILILLTLLLTLLSRNLTVRSQQATRSMIVWTAPALESISLETNLPQKQVSIPNTIQLHAARGESESFQIAVQAPENRYLSNVNIAVSDLRHQKGAAITQTNLTLYREHYVYVNDPTPANWIGNATQGKGWYADGLIPFSTPVGQELEGAKLDAVPFDLAFGKTQPIWVDINVPRNIAAGQYEGTYTVSSDQGKKTGKIELTVWDFELPVKPTMNSYFNPWEDRGESLIEELLKHKVMPGKRIAPEQQAELIEQWGLNSVRLPFWSGANYSTCTLSPAPSVAAIQKAFETYDSSLLKFVFSADEVDKCPNIVRPIKEWAKNIHQAGAKHLVVMKPIPELYDDVDIWVVQPQMYQDSQQQIAKVKQLGAEVWFYTGHQTGYSPQWQIDVPPINFRVPQGFIAQSLGLTGVLYPQVDGWSDNQENLPLWSDDPWRKPSVYQQGDRNFPGEGMLLYPGAEVGIDGVVPSIRLKWIRDGIEDYEYIAILKRLGDEEWALKTSRTAAKNWQNWTKDPQVLENVRIKLAKRIQMLNRDRQQQLETK